MSKRELKDWMSAYLKYTYNTESPTSYHEWCGLSVIAGVLQRKVYFEWNFQKIYPNMYVILVGPSGRTRKGVALGIAKDLICNVPRIAVSPESGSAEAIILAMKRANEQFQDPSDGKIKFHCSLTAFSEELAVFLGQANIGLLSRLTDWYDSKDHWAYETVGRGRDSLDGVCFNLCGGTAPDWIQSMLPQEAVGGGFTSRAIFVVEEDKGKIVAKHTKTQEEKVLEQQLIIDLEKMSQLAGPMRFSDAADKAYQDWYTAQEHAHRRGEYEVDDPKFNGYCERRATHIKKISMLYACARSDDLTIELEDFNRALDTMIRTEAKMHKAFRGLGRNPNADINERILNYIKTVRITTKKVLMQQFYRDLSDADLDALEKLMEATGFVKIKHVIPMPGKPGNNVYTWIGGESDQPSGNILRFGSGEGREVPGVPASADDEGTSDSKV